MIKNIIFDLGNVLIDIDIIRSEQELKALLGENLLHNLKENGQDDVFLRYEVGKISEQEFVTILQSASQNKVESNKILNAWNAMLIGFKPQRFEMLQRLAKKYNLFVLSNTNKTHIDWVYRDLKVNHSIENYEEVYFNKVYYSHEIFLRKPDTEIYNFVLNDAQILAEDTLFIDDNFDNIEAAKKLNIHTIHHLLGNEIIDILKDF